MRTLTWGMKGQLEKLRRTLGIRKDETWDPPKADLRQYEALVEKFFRQLKEAAPSLSDRTAGAVATDLADLLDVSRSQEYYVREFLQLKLPKDARRLQKLLIRWIDVELLFHCQWHLKSLRRRLPKVLDAIPDAKKSRRKKPRVARKMNGT